MGGIREAVKECQDGWRDKNNIKYISQTDFANRTLMVAQSFLRQIVKVLDQTQAESPAAAKVPELCLQDTFASTSTVSASGSASGQPKCFQEYECESCGWCGLEKDKACKCKQCKATVSVNAKKCSTRACGASNDTYPQCKKCHEHKTIYFKGDDAVLIQCTRCRGINPNKCCNWQGTVEKLCPRTGHCKYPNCPMNSLNTQDPKNAEKCICGRDWLNGRPHHTQDFIPTWKKYELCPNGNCMGQFILGSKIILEGAGDVHGYNGKYVRMDSDSIPRSWKKILEQNPDDRIRRTASPEWWEKKIANRSWYQHTGAKKHYIRYSNLDSRWELYHEDRNSRNKDVIVASCNGGSPAGENSEWKMKANPDY